MKKQILILFLLVFCNISAQTTKFGIVIGNNTSIVYSDSHIEWLTDSHRIFQIHAGFNLDVPISAKLGVKTDLIYNNKILKTTNNSFIDDIKLNFIELAPNLKFSFNKKYSSGMYAIVGPKVSFMFSAKTGGEVINSDFRSVGFGLQGGLGGSLNELLSLEGKIDYGISTILSDNSDKLNFVSFILALNIHLTELFN